ncbi:MAG: holo-[acyl-carrier-protein] synthase [Calditrichaeota bacterium]|nr:holo-[acyl-carrier-protein] synthase [Calditrichota bacterium]
MIAGIGVDIVSVKRMHTISQRWQSHFLQKIFSDAEIAYCTAKTGQAVSQSFAARFAAKEAFKKALTAAGNARPLNWKEVWVEHTREGVPVFRFSDPLQQEMNGFDCHLSLSHENEFAIALVILETKKPFNF